MWEGARRKSVKGKKRRSHESEKQEQEERNGGPRNSSGSLPSGLVLARSQPSPSFAPFSFSSPYCRFKHSFEQGTADAMFFLERAYTYRLVCVQATFACSDRKRGKERKKTDKREGGGATEKIKKWTRE